MLHPFDDLDFRILSFWMLSTKSKNKFVSNNLINKELVLLRNLCIPYSYMDFDDILICLILLENPYIDLPVTQK